MNAETFASCKSDAFKNSQKSLTAVRDTICPLNRGDHNQYSHEYEYGATTLWFQCLLCKQQEISAVREAKETCKTDVHRHSKKFPKKVKKYSHTKNHEDVQVEVGNTDIKRCY